ncbi:unnamed protein product [Toxocara canis]|uniref:Uncharacterized protein n=1 Tax=Toxocara canis TaxID=6265 RepID=A0A183URG5_TOXCA|nr:unnamed protein product [Toxocara canis]
MTAELERRKGKWVLLHWYYFTDIMIKTSSQRISLNRSQYGGCFTEYNTLTSKQVVRNSLARPSKRALAVRKVTQKCLPTPRSKFIVALTRRNSELEAFIHNRSDDSFVPLANRPST